MSEKSMLDELRDKIKELTKKLEEATLEKGLAAEENKDLRENFAYDYWNDQENLYLTRIRNLMNEISQKGRGVKKISRPAPKIKKEEPFKPNTWL